MQNYNQFLPIPGYSNYEIDLAGLVRNIKTGNPVKPKSDKPNQVQIKNDEGTNKRVDFVDMAAKVHNGTPVVPSANSKLIIGKKGLKALVDKHAEPLTAASAHKVFKTAKLTDQQKIYWLKTVGGESHATIAARFGYTKDKVSGLYDRIRLSEAKLAEYNEALKTV